MSLQSESEGRTLNHVNRRRIEMKRVFKQLTLVAATLPFRVLLVALLAAELMYLAELTLDDRRRILETQQRDKVFELAASKRARIENALSSTIYLAQGLVAFIRSVDQPTERQIERALQTIYEADSRIRNIGLAPDNVIAHVYPLKGNEVALGLRYRDMPGQWPGVRYAMQAHQTVVTGPVQLIQRDMAVISRTPVYLESGRYWGMISIVIDLDALLGGSGATPVADNVVYKLLGDSLVGGERAVLLDQGPLDVDSAIEMYLHLGLGSWLLYAAPVGGWDTFERTLWIWRIQLYLGAVALCIFLYVILMGRAQAKRLANELSESNRHLAASNEALEYLSRYDPLTNVANRRYFDEVLVRSLAQCRRQNLPLAVLMVDLDHFKSINDRYGHAVGDGCLIRVAGLITKVLQRADDLVARFGGEEFIVLAPGLSPQQAQSLGERIRRAIAGTLIPHERGDTEPLRVTASVGLVSMVPARDTSGEELCRYADKALYRAKANGRNQVQTYMGAQQEKDQ